MLPVILMYSSIKFANTSYFDAGKTEEKKKIRFYKLMPDSIKLMPNITNLMLQINVRVTQQKRIFLMPNITNLMLQINVWVEKNN